MDLHQGGHVQWPKAHGCLQTQDKVLGDGSRQLGMYTSTGKSRMDFCISLSDAGKQNFGRIESSPQSTRHSVTLAGEPVEGGHAHAGSLPRRRKRCPELRQRRDLNPESSQRAGIESKAEDTTREGGPGKTNTRWVGNDSAGKRPDTLGPRRPLLSHSAVTTARTLCIGVHAHSHSHYASTAVLDTHSGGQGDC